MHLGPAKYLGVQIALLVQANNMSERGMNDSEFFHRRMFGSIEESFQYSNEETCGHLQAKYTQQINFFTSLSFLRQQQKQTHKAVMAGNF